MSQDTTIAYINSLDSSSIQGIGFKPERHTGINANWDSYIVAILPLGLIHDISQLAWVKTLEKTNETMFTVGSIIIAIILFGCGLALISPYMKIRDRIFPPKWFVVYIGVADTKRIIKNNVSKKRAIYLCKYMQSKWGFDQYQTEDIY